MAVIAIREFQAGEVRWSMERRFPGIEIKERHKLPDIGSIKNEGLVVIIVWMIMTGGKYTRSMKKNKEGYFCTWFEI